MAIDPEHLLNRPFPVIEHRYDEQSAILYALGVGLGADPLDRGQLRFVYEDGLKVLPSMAAILGYPGFWAKEPDTGIDWRRVVHAEQSFELRRPLASSASLVSRNRVTAVYDKGAATGALLCQEREVSEAATGERIVTVRQTAMLRGDGGFGGERGPTRAPHPIPTRAPDAISDLRTLPQAALIYRLSGDFNPLHADPDVAQIAGFPRPILLGLCTMGVACHAVLRTVLDYDPGPVRAMSVRFAAPVFPGETIRTEIWSEGALIFFRSSIPERGVVVLESGRIDLDSA